MITAALVFDELIFWMLSGANTQAPLFYGIIYALALGILVSTVCRVFGAKNRLVQMILAEAAALYFTVEVVVKEVFTFYFSPASLMSGAGGVASNYRDELYAGIAAGVPRFFLFSAVVLAYLAVKLVKRYRSKAGKSDSKQCGYHGSETKFSAAMVRLRPEIAVLFSIVLFCAADVQVLAGPDASAYGSQYSFSMAVETFGLTEATLLSARYAIAGNPYESFGDGGFGIDVQGDETSEEIANASDALDSGAEDENAEAGLESLPEPIPVVEYNVMDIDFPHEGVAKSVDKLSAYLEQLAPSEKNDYTGIFAGKNLIMICAESYCSAFITPELTPTLWRLTHEGIYFSDYYQPSWGGSTTTGELSMVLGQDSNEGADAMQKVAGNNHYFSMGNQLQRQGYFSLAFHNGAYTYYGRNKTHTGLGYDAFFAASHHLNDFCGSSYPTDTDMIANTWPAYVDHQPFSVYYMTVSGHAPYKKDSPLVKKYYDRVDEIVGDEYYEKTKYYICYQMELESALTALMEKIDEAGIADDTVIVLTGDHYPYGLGNGKGWGNDRDYIDDLIKCDDILYWNEDKSGLIIWSGCLENELKNLAVEVSEPVHSLDILPTVSNMFGVEFDSRLLPGRDVFADTEPCVYWNNESWITKEGKYDSRKRVFYPAEGTEEKWSDPEAQKRYIEATAKFVANKVLMSSVILKQDYYGIIFGKDEDGANPDEVWAMLKEELAERKAAEKAAEEAAAEAEKTEEAAKTTEENKK